jgi:enoyl-CoA hydratase/carnithine racemase
MKAYESIRYSAEGGVAQLELHRPERINALGKSMLLEIQHAMDTFEADAALRVLVVHGAGRGFSSGFDLKEQMTRNPQGAQVWREILDLDFSTTMRFWDCPKPTVAAIHGPCMAGAFEMALACDISVCSRDAVFGEPELKFGAGIVTLLLPWMVGPKAAKDMLLTGDDAVNAERALALGLVSRVVPDDQLMAEAKKLAERVAVNPPRAVRLAKRLLREAQHGRLSDIMELSAAFQALAHETADHKEAVDAFTEKRAPKFTGG